MSDGPSNIPLIVNGLINELLKTAGLKEAFALLVAQLPFLGWGPIGWITGLVISWVGGFIFKALEKFVAFKIIDWQTIEENAEYQVAVTQLQAAQTSGDQAALDKARADFKEKLSKLIHYDGV